jgi:hypothetical protein
MEDWLAENWPRENWLAENWPRRTGRWGVSWGELSQGAF